MISNQRVLKYGFKNFYRVAVVKLDLLLQWLRWLDIPDLNLPSGSRGQAFRPAAEGFRRFEREVEVLDLYPNIERREMTSTKLTYMFESKKAVNCRHAKT